MKIGMLFPGYGSQFVGMAKELYDNSRIVQEYFEEASNCLNINFVKLCFASSDAELSRIQNAYVALFLTSTSIAALLKESGVTPHIVAGYDIGELSALSAAGGMSLPDGLYFLNKYAHFYQELLPSLDAKAFRVMGLTPIKLNKLCKQHHVDIGIYVTDTEHIITGAAQVVTEVAAAAKKMGATIKEIPIEAGLHSSMMDPVVTQLKTYSAKVDFKDIEIPLIASVEAKIVQKGELIKNRIIKQINAPILWSKVMHQCANWDIIIQIGPGTEIAEKIRQLFPEKKVYAINNQADIDALKSNINTATDQSQTIDAQ